MHTSAAQHYDLAVGAVTVSDGYEPKSPLHGERAEFLALHPLRSPALVREAHHERQSYVKPCKIFVI
jgi:hypothetical protein